VIGSDYKGRLGEAPRPELRAHGRISGACFDAAMGVIPDLKVQTIPTLLFSLPKYS
jgi:UDP-arabinose 4-epimerase